MRVMVLIKANEQTEAGVLPSEKLLTDMQRYNEELVRAGLMLAGDGLQPSSQGVRVELSRTGATVTDGPFAETKELIAGYWLWQVRSLDEAIEWVKRIPLGENGTEQPGLVEIRPVYEADDFGEAFTPQLRAREAELRQRTETAAQ